MKKHLLFLKKATVMLAAMALAALTACENGIQTITKIELSANTESITVGGTATVTATITPATSTDAITWKSSDPEKATTDAQGTTCIVKGVSAGKVTIIASSGNVSDSIEITVSSASSGENNSDNSSGGSNQGTGIYANFYNYPTGRTDPNGTLTLKNQVNTPVLVFTDSVAPENYICTIDSSSSQKVKLDSEKFYNLVSVVQKRWEYYKPDEGSQPSQTCKLAYYSDTQDYTVSVTAKDLSIGGVWTFNNDTNYWVSIDGSDESETYAIIAPKAQQMTIPANPNTKYNYTIIYLKELKKNNQSLAISEISRIGDNDLAEFNLTVTTKLELTLDSEYDTLSPTVQIFNKSGEPLRVYKNDIQISSFGELESNDDYVLANGDNGVFTGFAAGETFSSLKIKSTEWDETCTKTGTFQKGKVYVVTVNKNTSTDSNASPITWAVEEKAASEFYDKEQ